MGLTNVQKLFDEYLKEPVKVRLTPGEAKEVWKIFRSNPMSEGRFNSLKNRAFLQAALVATIDGSKAMGWVKALFTSAYKPTASVKGIIKKLIQHGISSYRNRKEPPEIYRSVVVTVAWQNKFYFDSISQNLEI